MCIIIYHPEDTNMVSKQVLKHCWDKNSDGAGYSYWDQASKMWLVNKGFMSWMGSSVKNVVSKQGIYVMECILVVI